MAKVNKSQYAIMGMLSIEPMSGYEIRRNMEQSTNHFWKESDGQLYPTLERLVKEEKIVCQGVRKHGARESKVYEITDKGREALKAWLDDPSAVFLIRSEFLLKIFFGANTTREKIADHVRAFQQQRKERLQRVYHYQRELEAMPKSEKTLYWRLCCSYGEKQAKALIEWSEEALQVLEE